jgi:low affinity Fe/Cu permease
METKYNKLVCRAIHILANLFILMFVFFFAFIAVCAIISTLFDFSVWTLMIAIVSSTLGAVMLNFYREERL